MDYTLIIGIAVFGGIAVTVQGQFMGLISQIMGTKVSVFVTYVGGGLLMSLLMLPLRSGQFSGWQSVPWYAYGSGVVGLIIVGSIASVVPKLGLSSAMTVLVAAQLISAALIDHFGLFGASQRPIGLPQLLGIALLVLGAWLVLKGPSRVV